MGVTSWTDPPIPKAADEMYEMPSPQPLPTISATNDHITVCGGDVGVAKEGEEEVFIPGDQRTHDMSQ